MEDSDAIRALIERRLNDLGLDQAEVSRALGKSRTYLNDYLIKRSPRAMSNDMKLGLSRILKMPAAALGVPAVVAISQIPGGMMEDAIGISPRPNFPVAPANITFVKMLTQALDQHPRRIVPGNILAIDVNDVDPAKIAAGKVVLAQLTDSYRGTKNYGTVVRQFIPPNKLVTNSSGVNEIISLTDPSTDIIAVVKGSLAYIIDDVAENSEHPGT
jgi:transcriptional regulator with XRE-family HTH domain